MLELELRFDPMATKKIAPSTAISPWDRVLRFEEEPSPTAARALLKLEFSQADRERMAMLSAKARAGTLTAEEEQDAETFERLGCVLDILHSTARRALKPRRTAS
jgi:hypothetical protein